MTPGRGGILLASLPQLAALPGSSQTRCPPNTEASFLGANTQRVLLLGSAPTPGGRPLCHGHRLHYRTELIVILTLTS